jgi:hypothetical protein
MESHSYPRHKDSTRNRQPGYNRGRYQCQRCPE